MSKPQPNKGKVVEVKKFFETDRCEFCNRIQGGYIDWKIERHINVRDKNKCANCGVPEKPL